MKIHLSYQLFGKTEVTAIKGPMTQIKKLAGKAQQFTLGVKKAGGHLRRLGDENDRERSVDIIQFDWNFFNILQGLIIILMFQLKSSDFFTFLL